MPDNASTAVATRDNSPVGQLQQMLQERARDIQMALPAHIKPDKFQRTVLTAAAQNPDLLRADRGSLILAVYKAAQDGLLPDGREAALVIFSTRKKIDGQFQTVKQVQYMPMVYGLRKKILQSADVVALEVGVVYATEVANGYFRYEVGTEPPLNHAPMLDIPDDEATDDKIVAAYSIATMRDGTRSYEVMRRSEINKVRQTSQTGALGQTVKFGADKGKPIEPKGPWVDWFAEMAKKTVMRRHSKTLPMSGDVLLDVEDRGLDPAKSAAWALSVDADEPTLITDESGDTIDSATGEVVDEGGKHDEPEQGGEDEQRDEAGQSGEVNDLFVGDAQNPMTEVAEELIEAMSAAPNVPMLKALYDGAQLDIAGMPDDTATACEQAYDRNLKRLGTSRAKVAAALTRAKAEAEPAK